KVDEWQRVTDTNLSSEYLVGRESARGWVERGEGNINHMCSGKTDVVRPTISADTSTSGGLRNRSSCMAAVTGGAGPQGRSNTPAGRWGTVEDLAGPAVWLASGGSNYVNGQTIFIDGGMSVVV